MFDKVQAAFLQKKRKLLIFSENLFFGFSENKKIVVFFIGIIYY